VTIRDVRAVLSAYLVASGTAGHTEKEIMRRFQHIPKEDILMELHSMWEQEKVQRFTLDPKRVIWRATDYLNM
jgi:hypothetical protein